MTFDPAALLAHDFGETRQAYAARDVVLYALGLGLGPDDLAFVYENALTALPSFAVTLASPGMWIRDPRFGVDFARLVHAAQRATFHAPLPVAGAIIGTARIASLADRGEDKGAVLVLGRRIADADTGRLLCTLEQTLLLRGNGGFSGPPPPRSAPVVPNSAPDLHATATVSPRAALIYRLSGDWNPLHIDPAAAHAAGFDRPILHGLASYGMAAIAIARAAGASPAAVTSLACRFSGIVFPGDTLDFRIWRTADAFAFTAHVGDRKVLDDGLLTLES